MNPGPADIPKTGCLDRLPVALLVILAVALLVILAVAAVSVAAVVYSFTHLRI
jgi:hypothetical protein